MCQSLGARLHLFAYRQHKYLFQDEEEIGLRSFKDFHHLEQTKKIYNIADKSKIKVRCKFLKVCCYF